MLRERAVCGLTVCCLGLRRSCQEHVDHRAGNCHVLPRVTFSGTMGCRVDLLGKVWQSTAVQKRSLQLWFAILGMVAMIGALASMPLASTSAFAMSGKSSASTMKMAHGVTEAAADEMPCHKPAKHCPNCPEKACSDMGSCLVKCFQSLSSPASAALLDRNVAGERVLPTLSLATVGSLIPPLLRPPSV